MNNLIEQEVSGKPVEVSLRNGQKYPLSFPMGVIILVKQLTGKNLFDLSVLKDVTPTEDPEAFLSVLWAAMHRYDGEQRKLVPPIALEELGMLVDFGNITDIAMSIRSALEAYLPKPEPVSPNVPAPATEVA